MIGQVVSADHSQKYDSFVPPTEVASAEEQQGSKGTAGSLPPEGPPKKKRRSVGEWFKALSGKQKLLITLATVVVVSGATVGAYFAFFNKQPAPAPIVAKKVERKVVPPQPTTVASNLTGLQVDPSVNERPVTGIMIENSTDARPQSALSQAGVVFEAIAEGGITRFLTLWQDTEPDYIGPVRSVRPYYIQWAMGFDAAIAHVGGSPDGLAAMKSWHAKDLDQFAGAAYFWRISQRAAPHNMYTSIAKLREYENKKGYGKSSFTAFVRKAKEAPSSTPTARNINFNISSATYNVHYEYDQATNSYKRSEGGAPHLDQSTNAQLSPKVVVALVMPQGLDGKYTTYQTIGSGQVLIFQDGTVTTGTWKKDSNNANFSFTDANGSAIGLNPGQTWLTALGGTDRISYTP